MAGADERITRPQLCPVVDEEHASGGVSRGNRPENKVTEGARVPPIELDDLRRRNPPPFEVGADPERAHEHRGAVLESDDRRVVEVVVVVVGDEHGIEGRQVTDGEQRRKETLGTGEADGPDPFAPHRVGEEAMPIDLEQDRRMAQPRNADSRGGRRRETAWFYGNRARWGRGLHVGPARELVTDGRPEVVHDRLRVLEVRPLPLGRLPHPFEPDTRRAGPEGGAARNGACGEHCGHAGGDHPAASTAWGDPSVHLAARESVRRAASQSWNVEATIRSSWTSAACGDASHTIGGPMIDGSSSWARASAGMSSGIIPVRLAPPGRRMLARTGVSRRSAAIT